MRYRLKVYSIWETGDRKDADGNPQQEDCIFPAHGASCDEDRLFILCDGMGGRDAGDVASAAVCEGMSSSVLSGCPDPEGEFDDGMLVKAIDDAARLLDSKDTGALRKMGTTMAFLKLHSGGCTIAHIGDSRVYHIRPGKDVDSTRILFRTEDHSLVSALIRKGVMTPEEARRSPHRHIITRSMMPGASRRPRADVYHTADIRPGDYFFLCSDGMLEQMEDEDIQFSFSGLAGDDAHKVRLLTQATSNNHDNHTGIIVHVEAVEGGSVPKDDEAELEELLTRPQPKVPVSRPVQVVTAILIALICICILLFII